MEDVTLNVGKLHAALQRVVLDINRLADDFRRALAEAGQELPESSAYSYSPNALHVKSDHAWLFAQTNADSEDEAEVTYAAMYVLFAASAYQRKLAGEGRPELWFIFGRTTGFSVPAIAKSIRTFANHGEAANYSPPLAAGGEPSFYELDEDSSWEAAVLVHELGAIDSTEALHAKVMQPILGMARAKGLLAAE